mgnify:CR=1 FL=1
MVNFIVPIAAGGLYCPQSTIPTTQPHTPGGVLSNQQQQTGRPLTLPVSYSADLSETLSSFPAWAPTVDAGNASTSNY